MIGTKLRARLEALGTNPKKRKHTKAGCGTRNRPFLPASFDRTTPEENRIAAAEALFAKPLGADDE